MKKKIILVLIAAILMLTACDQSTKNNITVNSAISTIAGADRLLNETDNNLFLLKEYGTATADEVNQIENLVIGTTEEESGEYYTYFLLVPKYTGSTIKLERVEWDDETSDVKPTETAYEINETPDNYGLIIASNEPEALPNLRVTVSYGTESYSYVFSYDGKGDRPEILVFPEDENWAHAN